MTMFKSDVQSARLSRGYRYGDAVTTGRLLCQQDNVQKNTESVQCHL